MLMFASSMFDFLGADWVAMCRTTPTEPSASGAACPNHTTVSTLLYMPMHAHDLMCQVKCMLAGIITLDLTMTDCSI